MEETDMALFGSKKKHDKADAIRYSDQPQRPADSENARRPQIFSIPTYEDTYKCDSPNLGVALIFNHKRVKGAATREGTGRDRDALEKSLSLYGFDVRVHNDLTVAKLQAVLQETAKEDHSRNDCLLVAVMSHGKEGCVYAKDDTYATEELWKPFMGSNCRSLINKPKIFVIQACRGTGLETPVVYSRGISTMSRALPSQPFREEVVRFAIPSTADILTFYSTFERHYSFRNVKDGSWFIQTLCQVLNEVAVGEARSERGVELLKLFTTINRRVAYEKQSETSPELITHGKKEMPNFVSTLTKTFYLRVKSKENMV